MILWFAQYVVSMEGRVCLSKMAELYFFSIVAVVAVVAVDAVVAVVAIVAVVAVVNNIKITIASANRQVR